MNENIDIKLDEFKFYMQNDEKKIDEIVDKNN